MKKIVLLLAFTCCLGSFAQPYFGVYTPTILPQNPTSSDQIKVIMKIISGSGTSKLSKSSAVNQQTLNLSSCIMVYATSVISYQTDTFNIGTLTPGQYIISYTAVPSFTGSCAANNYSSYKTDTFFVSGTTSIKELHSEPFIHVYPNPFTEKIFVRTNTDKPAKKITVTNILGQLVFTADKINTNEEIDLRKLPSGIYWIKIDYAERSKSVKIIKE